MSITKKEYARRQQDLMNHMESNSIAILPAASYVRRNGDVDFSFRQDSDFYYLCGFTEPKAVLALIPGRQHGEVVLFCQEKDPTAELWHGARLGPEKACEKLAVDDAFPIDDIDDILPGLIEGHERVYYSMGTNAGFDHQVMEWVKTIRKQASRGSHPPNEFLVLDHLLHDLRLFKSTAEIRLMEKAATISAQAHIRAMEVCSPGMKEYELEAEFMHEFTRNGSRSSAYPAIIGGGKNACILHYNDNNGNLKDGDLVLIDAGCEYEYYAADITRTFPVNGQFNKEQSAIYELVLAAQDAAMAVIKPGNHWNQPHEASVKVITQGLCDLGILKGPVDELIETESYKDFYMHKVGHWLGLDVHDVGEYKLDDQWRVLERGMVMTVEPGIYIAPDNSSVARKWRGIGVRIEDDVLITKSGHQVLSHSAPKTISEIESIMKQ